MLTFYLTTTNSIIIRTFYATVINSTNIFTFWTAVKKSLPSQSATVLCLSFVLWRIISIKLYYYTRETVFVCCHNKRYQYTCFFYRCNQLCYEIYSVYDSKWPSNTVNFCTIRSQLYHHNMWTDNLKCATMLSFTIVKIVLRFLLSILL